MPFTGYNEVVRIPSGATNIDVRQHSYSGKPEDDNYLGKTSSTFCSTKSSFNFSISIDTISRHVSLIFNVNISN